MRLTELITDVEIKRLTVPSGAGDGGPEVTGISLDSRRVRPGDLFAALPGACTDGNRFASDAMAKGAAAVLTECPLEGGPQAAVIEVEDARAALAAVSARFYGSPSEKMRVTGITGTNGKTTTSYLIDSGLRAAGHETGVIGTIKYVICGEECASLYTTPEAPEFQHLLARMLGAGATHAVAEVSSHALAQKRVDATIFRTAVFTNLTRDHLDYHGEMEAYYLSKRRLFTELLEGTAVINCDDAYGKRLLKEINNRDKVRAVSYGLAEGADIRAAGINHSMEGLSFRTGFMGESYEIRSALMGLHNVHNMLAAFGALVAEGVPPAKAAEGIGALRSVKGRFERVPGPRDFAVIVDYAHTPDAMERLVASAREVASGRVITVFGCGGDRDRGKRPLMGRAASMGSDFAVVTSDNPRSEDPLAIIEDVKPGLSGRFEIVPVRAEAIKMAVRMAAPGDVVLIAGKGHEDYQEAKGRRTHFSDAEEAAKAIKERLEEKAC